MSFSDTWGALMKAMEERVIQIAKQEDPMHLNEENPESILAMTPVMEKYGYRSGDGWWKKKD